MMRSYLSAAACHLLAECPDDVYAWQTQAIQNAVKKADGQNAKLIDHRRVVAWVSSWGTSDELDMP